MAEGAGEDLRTDGFPKARLKRFRLKAEDARHAEVFKTAT
jgi:hypothetical protein